MADLPTDIMKNHLSHIVILFLIVSLVTLGVAAAGGDRCPPDCSHCQTVKISSCCDEMAGAAGHATDQAGGQEGPADCRDGSFCPENTEQKEEVAAVASQFPDAALLPAVAILSDTGRSFLPDRGFQPSLPFSRKPPLLYILNCSYLI